MNVNNFIKIIEFILYFFIIITCFIYFLSKTVIAMQPNFRKIGIIKLVLKTWDFIDTEASTTSNQFTFTELQL